MAEGAPARAAAAWSAEMPGVTVTWMRCQAGFSSWSRSSKASDAMA
ncbi:MAG: hypothetical protein R3F54_22165 [Alphaproteobacteria bacterium]